MNKRKGSRMNTKTLVQAAILVAISIVLTRVGSIMILPTLRLGFGETPLLMAGFLFGPIVGGLSGLVADLVGFVINPQGPWHPGFTFSSVMWGVIAGLFAMYYRSNNETKDTKNLKEIFTPLRITIAVAVAMIIISLGLNTFWLSRLYGKGFIAMIPGRILTFLVSTPIQSYVINLLLKHIRPMTDV